MRVLLLRQDAAAENFGASTAMTESAKLFGVKLKEQQEAILSFIQGHDSFVSLPTGYGKSLIYGILPTILYDKLKGRQVLTCI